MKIVYIDSQNVHKALENYHHWTIDWKRFFVYIKEKYHTDKIKIFFGYIKKYQKFYNMLSNIGFDVCFKEALYLPNREIKGNVDIDIAIIALKDFYEFGISTAYLVTGDGDYNSLISFWIEKGVFGKVFVPGVHNSSILLKKVAKHNLIDLAVMIHKLQKKKPS